MKKNRLKILLFLFLLSSLFVIVFVRYVSESKKENEKVLSQTDPETKNEVFIPDEHPVSTTREFEVNTPEEYDSADTDVSETAVEETASDSEDDNLRKNQILPDGRHYTEKTYQLVTDIVYSYKKDPDDWESVQLLLDSLAAEDEDLGKAWLNIMKYWDYARKEMPIDNAPPDHLPDDSEMCIVVLGFQLFSDGTMTDELLGRCEKALLCANRYPNSWLAVCGGGTASLNSNATEAQVMAEWFLSNGISSDRLILEDRSQTTVENAAFLHQILSRTHPEIRDLLIVSSDYHIPISSLLFSAEAFLSEWKNGSIPYRVIGNTSFETNGDESYTSISTQAQYLWSLADPAY